MRKNVLRATDGEKRVALAAAKEIFDDFVSTRNGNRLEEIQSIVDGINDGCIKFDMAGDDMDREFMFCPGVPPRNRQTMKKDKKTGLILPSR